jgi:hypothetical protein
MRLYFNNSLVYTNTVFADYFTVACKSSAFPSPGGTTKFGDLVVRDTLGNLI